MVQWFKALIFFLFGDKSRIPAIDMTVLDKAETRERAFDQMLPYLNSEGVIRLESLIRVERDILILNLTKARTIDELSTMRGSAKALSDLLTFLSDARSPELKREAKKAKILRKNPSYGEAVI